MNVPEHSGIETKEMANEAAKAGAWLRYYGP